MKRPDVPDSDSRIDGALLLEGNAGFSRPSIKKINLTAAEKNPSLQTLLNQQSVI